MTTDKVTYHKEKLTKVRTELEEILSSLTEEQWQTPIISEEQTWTVANVVAHLLENERGMSIHVHKIRQGKETVPEDFDLEAWNRGLKKRAGNPGSQELLENLSQTRAKTLEVLETITDEEWKLQGRHPFRGLITIEEYYETMAGHDAWHLKDIKEGLGLK